MAYKTPNRYFAGNNFYLTKNSNGTFTVSAKQSANYQNLVVYDDVTNNGSGTDSNAQLGDVSGDQFHSHVVGNNSSAFQGTFIGSVDGGNSFIGKFSGTPSPGRSGYYLYGGAAHSVGDILTPSSTAITLCFAAGTLIRTMRGDVAVEDLVVGDLAVTSSGASRPIRWLGHRKVDCAAHAAPSQMWPVRILAGAFGPGVPARDLYLSPGHPILVGADEDGEGGHLVPAMCLINGTTIDRVKMDSVTYWHVELDEHDILLAEGLPAESYLDWGDRAFFSEAEEHALTNPDFVVPGLAGRCRPVALDGPVVEAERRRLDGVLSARLIRACAWPKPELLALI